MVAGQCLKPPPVAGVRVDRDHRTDCGATAESAAARVENAAAGSRELLISPLDAVVLVVADEEAPAQVPVLAGVGLHDRDLVIRTGMIIAGLQHHDRMSRAREIRRERTPAGA